MDDTLVDKVVDGAIAASLALFTWLSLHVIGLLGTRDETNSKYFDPGDAGLSFE